jgi:hypothetical protein
VTDIDFLLHAQHGLAQVAELGGQLDQAERLYREVAEHSHAGGSGRHAKTALERLRALRQLRPGVPCTDMPVRIDLAGERHDLGRLPRSRPLVFLYCSPLNQESVTGMRAYRRVLEASSKDVEVVVVALSRTREPIETLRATEQWEWPVLYGGEGWLDPLALRFGIHKVPGAVLLGPGLEFLGGGLPPEELHRLLEQLLGR